MRVHRVHELLYGCIRYIGYIVYKGFRVTVVRNPPHFLSTHVIVTEFKFLSSNPGNFSGGGGKPDSRPLCLIQAVNFEGFRLRGFTYLQLRCWDYV